MPRGPKFEKPVEVKGPVECIPSGIGVLRATPEGAVIPAHITGLPEAFLSCLAEKQNLRNTVTYKMVFYLNLFLGRPRSAELVKPIKWGKNFPADKPGCKSDAR